VTLAVPPINLHSTTPYTLDRLWGIFPFLSPPLSSEGMRRRRKPEEEEDTDCCADIAARYSCH
jgi:hypothetical protein